jgi:hypothetical protein
VGTLASNTAHFGERSGMTLTEFRKLTLDALRVGEEFVSDDHLVLQADRPARPSRRCQPWICSLIFVGLREVVWVNLDHV